MISPDLSPPSSPFALLAADMGKATELLRQQMEQPWRSSPGPLLMIALAVVAIVLIWPARHSLLRALRSWLQRIGDAELRILSLAVATAILTPLLFGFGARLLLAAIASGIPLLAESRALGETMVGGFVAAGLGLGLGRALKGRESRDRPVDLPDTLASVLPFYGLIGGIALGLAGFVQRTSAILHASPTGWAAGQILILLIELPLLAAFLVAVGKSRGDSEPDTHQRNAPLAAMTAIGWAVLLLAVGAALTGHLATAVLLTQELIWASFIVTLAMLVARFLNALTGWLLGDDGRAGRFARHIMGLRRERIRQTCIVGSALATLLVWMVAISLILAPLGGAGASLVDQVRPGIVFDGLRQLNLAPKAVAVALFVLIAGVVMTRVTRRWLEQRFLPATALDPGVRSSIVTGIGYAGILAALLAATSALGISLDKITLVASALSVGIGFGLQSIIQNFVSGVILLLERPIEVGDWVSASGSEGSVRRIRVRATELETADGGIAIVPNSAFISSPVLNRAGAGVAGRVELTLTVTGADSPNAARDALLALMRGRDGVLADPKPQLLITGASADSYTFKLRAWSADGGDIDSLRSELIYTLVAGLAGGSMKASIS